MDIASSVASSTLCSWILAASFFIGSPRAMGEREDQEGKAASAEETARFTSSSEASATVFC